MTGRAARQTDRHGDLELKIFFISVRSFSRGEVKEEKWGLIFSPFKETLWSSIIGMLLFSFLIVAALHKIGSTNGEYPTAGWVRWANESTQPLCETL